MCGRPRAWPSSWTVPLRKYAELKPIVQAEVGADLAGDRVVVDDGRAAVAGAADAPPVAEPLRPVADVDEDPPDVPLALDPQLPLGLLAGLAVAFRLVVDRVGGGAVPFHIGHLDRPVGVAPEESRDGRRILPSLHLAEEESLGRVGDLRQAMGDARGGRPIGRREQDDPDRRRGRLEARVGEPPPVRRERAGAERPVAADDPGDVLGLARADRPPASGRRRIRTSRSRALKPVRGG